MKYGSYWGSKHCNCILCDFTNVGLEDQVSFKLKDNERIVNVDVGVGKSIDNVDSICLLHFHTNKNNSYGPFKPKNSGCKKLRIFRSDLKLGLSYIAGRAGCGLNMISFHFKGKYTHV